VLRRLLDGQHRAWRNAKITSDKRSASPVGSRRARLSSQRGEELVAAGQLGPARLVLRRAAEAGDSDAAFALAITYDPILLRTRTVVGFAPDNAMARAWYEKAKELGSVDASRRLEAIGQEPLR